MTTKTKEYQNIKFPYQVISDALKVFHRSLPPKNKKYVFEIWGSSYLDTSWQFDNEEQFRSEYVRDEVLRANLERRTSESSISISYSKIVSKSSISVQFSSVDKIERAFAVFDEYFKKYSKELEDEAKKTSEIAKIEGTSKASDAQQAVTRPLPLYRVETEVPSIFLDIKLLAKLEQYIRQRISQVVTDQSHLPEYLQAKYSLIISDSYGTLNLKSISEFDQDIFDGDTKYINIAYAGPVSDLEIDITFTKFKDSSKMKIKYKGENARDVAESIKNGVLNILKENKTNNAFYHSELLRNSLGALAAISVFFMLGFLNSKNTNWSLLGTAFTVLIFSLFVLLVAPSVKPYIILDTKKNRSIMGWNKWLIEAILAAFIGWILFTLLIPILFR